MNQPGLDDYGERRRIRHVFCDFYGTLLVFNPTLQDMAPRQGLSEFLDFWDNRDVPVTITSDADPEQIRSDAKIYDIPLGRFNAIRRVVYGDKATSFKDFRPLLHEYELAGENVMVFGDSFPSDITAAIKVGAQYCHVASFNTLPFPSRLDTPLRYIDYSK